MRFPLRRGLAALVLSLAFLGARPAAAQHISGDEIDRAYRPGPYVPGDGMPFSHRYNYYTGPSLYFNGSARQMWLQDYMDRVDRANRFGYCPPPVPRYLQRPYCPPPPSQVGVGVIIVR